MAKCIIDTLIEGLKKELSNPKRSPATIEEIKEFIVVLKTETSSTPQINNSADEEIEFQHKSNMPLIKGSFDIFKDISDSLRKLFPGIKVSLRDNLVDDYGERVFGRAINGAIEFSLDGHLDTMPHEYAHVYINMLENTPTVDNAIKHVMSRDKVDIRTAKETLASYLGEKFVESTDSFITKFRNAIVSLIKSIFSPKIDESIVILSNAFNKGYFSEEVTANIKGLGKKPLTISSFVVTDLTSRTNNMDALTSAYYDDGNDIKDIGTIEQYHEYLASRYNNIFIHYGPTFDRYDAGKTETSRKDLGHYLNFTDKEKSDVWRWYREDYIGELYEKLEYADKASDKAAIQKEIDAERDKGVSKLFFAVDIKKPYVTNSIMKDRGATGKESRGNYDSVDYTDMKPIADYIKEGYDSLIEEDSQGYIHQGAILTDNYIRLGSKQDLVEFKNFVIKSSSNAMPESVITLNEGSNSLLVPTRSPDGLTSEVIKTLDGFAIKDEFHLTVFGFPQGKEITEWLKTNGTRRMAKLQALIDEADFSYKELPELYKIERDLEQFIDWQKPELGKKTVHEEAVIQLVRASGVETFINKVNAELGFNFPVPFPHISIAIKGSKFGIGIANKEAFKKLNPVELNRDERSNKELKERIASLKSELIELEKTGAEKNDIRVVKEMLAEAEMDYKDMHTNLEKGKGKTQGISDTKHRYESYLNKTKDIEKLTTELKRYNEQIETTKPVNVSKGFQYVTANTITVSELKKILKFNKEMLESGLFEISFGDTENAADLYEDGSVEVRVQVLDNTIEEAVVLNHELVHVATFARLTEEMTEQEVSSMLHKFKSAVRSILDENKTYSLYFRNRLDYIASQKSDIDKLAEIYAIVDSEPDFRKELYSLLDANEKSIFRRVLQYIRKLLDNDYGVIGEIRRDVDAAKIKYLAQANKLGATDDGIELNEVITTKEEIAELKKANDAYKGKIEAANKFWYDTETGNITVIEPNEHVTPEMYEVYKAHEIRHAMTYKWLEANQDSPEFKYLLRGLERAYKILEPGMNLESNLLANRLRYAMKNQGTDLNRVAEIVAILSVEPNIRKEFIKQFPQMQQTKLEQILETIKKFKEEIQVDEVILQELKETAIAAIPDEGCK